jgi:hypothetical protein
LNIVPAALAGGLLAPGRGAGDRLPARPGLPAVRPRPTAAVVALWPYRSESARRSTPYPQ